MTNLIYCTQHTYLNHWRLHIIHCHHSHNLLTHRQDHNHHYFSEDVVDKHIVLAFKRKKNIFKTKKIVSSLILYKFQKITFFYEKLRHDRIHTFISISILLVFSYINIHHLIWIASKAYNIKKMSWFSV